MTMKKPTYISLEEAMYNTVVKKGKKYLTKLLKEVARQAVRDASKKWKRKPYKVDFYTKPTGIKE